MTAEEAREKEVAPLIREFKGITIREISGGEEIIRQSVYEYLDKNLLKLLEGYLSSSGMIKAPMKMKIIFLILPILSGWFFAFSLINIYLGDIKTGLAAIGPAIAALVASIGILRK